MSKVRRGPVAELKEENRRLKDVAAHEREEHLRAVADFENYRRRTQRELENVRCSARDSLVERLVPVLDSFERALEATSDEPGRENWLKGVRLIRQQLMDALAGAGLVEYSCLGEVFDPRRAEAVGFVNSVEHENDMVVEEHCRGYSCGDRVVRPARVVVARSRGQEHPDRDVSVQDEQRAADVGSGQQHSERSDAAAHRCADGADVVSQ